MVNEKKMPQNNTFNNTCYKQNDLLLSHDNFLFYFKFQYFEHVPKACPNFTGRPRDNVFISGAPSQFHMVKHQCMCLLYLGTSE